MRGSRTPIRWFITALLEIPDEEYDSPDAVVIELVAV
jgi:hypothetical protein